jgi:hypothetical protein
LAVGGQVSIRRNAWAVTEVDPALVQRIASTHQAHPKAVAMGADIISDPQRQDNEGFNWTRLRLARTVTDAVPGSTLVIGSAIGRYLAKVIAWDFEVSERTRSSPSSSFPSPRSQSRRRSLGTGPRSRNPTDVPADA